MSAILTVIVEDAIDPADYRRQVASLEVGAVVEFLGVVRRSEGEREISGIQYEAFREMAEHQLALLAQKYMAQYSIASLICVHRIGFVSVGEPSLYLRVASSHRAEAFQCMTEFIDELKREVPIWKRPVGDP